MAAARTKTSRKKSPKAAGTSRPDPELYRRLLRGHIIGIIDAFGAVHSRFTGETVECHGTFWPNQTHNRWRWNHDKSINCLVRESGITPEQYESVQKHLTRTYGLKWWENGHHDIADLLEKAGITR